MDVIPDPPTMRQLLERGVIGGLMHLTQRLHYRPELLADVEVVAHFKPVTDDDLRGILVSFDDFWDFDPVDAVVSRHVGGSGGKVRIDIDVSALALADVLGILDETRPAW